MLWVYCVFIAVGAGQGSFMPSAMNLIYDFAGERDKKTYMALIDSFLAPFALVFILGITDLFRIGRLICEQLQEFYGKSIEVLLVVALLFWVVSLILSQISLSIEKRLNVSN